MKEVSSMEKESMILDDADRLLTVQEVAKSAFNHFLTEYIGRDLRAEARAATLAGNLKETGG